MLIGFLCANTALRGQSAHEQLRDGDRLYQKSKFQEAERAYETARQKAPANDKAAYNSGVAQYRQGNYEKAAQSLSEAARLANTTDTKADALHNLGNAWLKQEKYKEAIDAYENSLRLRPGDAGSKRNLQMAKKKWQEQQQKEQQQQQNQQQQNQQSPPNQPQNPEQEQNQPQAPSPDADSQDTPSGQKQETPPASKLPPSGQQFLESIGREDQRNKRKYQENTNSNRPNTKNKDW